MSDQTELNSLVAKNACYAPQGISHSSLSQSWRDKQITAGVILLSLLFLKLVAFAKVRRYVTNAFLGFAKLNAILIAGLKIGNSPHWRRAWNRLMGEAHENLESRSLEFLSNYKMMACLVAFLLNGKTMYPSLNTLAWFSFEIKTYLVLLGSCSGSFILILRNEEKALRCSRMCRLLIPVCRNFSFAFLRL